MREARDHATYCACCGTLTRVAEDCTAGAACTAAVVARSNTLRAAENDTRRLGIGRHANQSASDDYFWFRRAAVLCGYAMRTAVFDGVTP